MKTNSFVKEVTRTNNDLLFKVKSYLNLDLANHNLGYILKDFVLSLWIQISLWIKKQSVLGDSWVAIYKNGERF